MRRTWTILAAMAALLALAPAARADDFAVNTVEDVAGTCSAEQCSIRQALTSAAATPDPDVVTIPAGTYTLSQGALQVDSAVTLRGAGARTTTITAGTAARVLDIGAVAARVEDLTVRDGTATAEAGFHGGNIRSQGGTVVLDRVRVTGGSAFSGGGVANNNGQLTILSSLIDHNAALQGGGDGGGILNFGGGGNAGALVVQDSTIAFNTARLGGGLISRGHPQNTVTLDGVTLARNAASDRGAGGISFAGGDGVVSARATIVAANEWQGLPSNCGGGGALTSAGGNVESGTECGLSHASDRRGVDALLAEQLTHAGGETDVLLPSPLSPAINADDDEAACGGADQRGVSRPRGPGCDAGAVELEYEVRIDSGPSGLIPSASVEFAFSSGRSPVSFECALDRPGGPVAEFGPCPAPASASYTGLAQGAHTFRVRALADGQPIGEAPRTFVVDTVAPVVTITSGPPRVSNDAAAVFEFTASEPVVGYACTHVFPDGSSDTTSCDSGWSPRDFVDGEHAFTIVATDAAGNEGRASASVLVDTSAPAPIEPSASGTATFTFGPGEPGTVFECRLTGPSLDTGFVSCTSPATYTGLAPGEYTFVLQTIDRAGNRAPEPRSRTFSIAAPPPTATAVPEPVATPRPVATPTPTPQAGETVVARPVSGRILVKRPNSTEFVELRASDDIPVGSEVNARSGRVALTIEPGNGKRAQRAVFYGGIFKISQPGATVDLTLSEPLAACRRSSRAAAAQSRPTSRKLWGDGKGKFRTRGRYSAATVRGTIWLVQDSCAGTLTRVRQGVVSVRDNARRKTVLVRAGRSYLAKARGR